MTPPLRIIQLLRGAQGGSFRHLRDLAREQADRGHQVGIVTSTGVGGANTDAALAALEPHCTLGIHRFPMDRSLGPSDVGAVRAIGRVFREARPHIVHGHGAKGAAYARLLARRAGAKAVYTPHGGSLHYSWRSVSGTLYLTLERVLMGRTDGLIFASDYSRRSYESKVGRPSCPTRVIHNGLHDDEFVPVPRGSEAYDFVFVGEIRLLKGIDVLLEAVVELTRERTLSVLMVGAGPDEAHLRERIGTLGLSDVVTLSPPIHPARKAFEMGRCIVMPSLAESLPYIVLEVLASRVPLLATHVGGIPEIFGPHSDSLLPPADAPALARAMGAFLDDPGAAMEEASRLHEYLGRHVRVPQMVDATMELYQAVLGAGPEE